MTRYALLDGLVWLHPDAGMPFGVRGETKPHMFRDRNEAEYYAQRSKQRNGFQGNYVSAPRLVAEGDVENEQRRIMR